MSFWGTALNSGASGLIEGVNAGIQQQGALRQMRRQEEHDQLAQQRYADELALRQGQQEVQQGHLALQRQQLEYQQQNQARDDELRKGQLALHQGQLGLQQRDQDIQDFNFQREKLDAERMDAANWSRQAIATLAAGGQVDPDEFEKNYTKASGGFSPRQLFSPEMAQHEATLTDWQAGKIRDHNDPRVHAAVKFMFPDITRRGLGEWTTQDIGGQKVSGKIVEKDIDQIGMVPQGKEGAGNLVASLRVKIADDKGNLHEYKAPLTQYGSAHPDDNLMLVSPVELTNRALKIAELRQMAQDHPRMAEMFAQQQPISPKDQSIIEKNQAAAEAYRAKAGGALAGNGKAGGKEQGFDAKKAGEYFGGVMGSEPSAAAWLDKRFGANGWESAGQDPVQSAVTEATKDANQLHVFNRDMDLSATDAQQIVSTGQFTRLQRPDGSVVEGYVVPSRRDPRGDLYPLRIIPPGAQDKPAGALPKASPPGGQTPPEGVMPEAPRTIQASALPTPSMPEGGLLNALRGTRESLRLKREEREKRIAEQGGLRGAILGR